MKCWQKHHGGRIAEDQYSRVDDFCSVFTKNTDRLYLLSLLLTGDHEKAEQTFVAGLEDSVEANSVFKDWAYSWAKRTIIHNAIRALNPHPVAKSSLRGTTPIRKDRSAHYTHCELYRVLALEDFERFVFVLSVLERYTDHECALLMGCSLQEIQDARMQALQHLAAPVLGGSSDKEEPGKSHVALH